MLSVVTLAAELMESSLDIDDDLCIIRSDGWVSFLTPAKGEGPVNEKRGEINGQRKVDDPRRHRDRHC